MQILIFDILFGYTFLRFGYKKKIKRLKVTKIIPSHLWQQYAVRLHSQQQEKDNLQATPGPPSVLVSKLYQNMAMPRPTWLWLAHATVAQLSTMTETVWLLRLKYLLTFNERGCQLVVERTRSSRLSFKPLH